MSAVATSGPGVKPKAVTMNVRARAQDWLSALNLHYAGVALLGLVNLYLLIHMAVAWQEAKSQDAQALAQQQVALKTAQIAARPLEGLELKLAAASRDADRFYRDRLPVSYSQVLTELGALSKRDAVRLTHVNYSEAPVAGEGASGESTGQLTEVRMDATLSGDYRPLVLFLNGLERDKVFFMITGVTLTGQQSGAVNLRIRLVTYLRGLAPAERVDDNGPGLPGSEADDDAAGPAPTAGGIAGKAGAR